MPKSSPKKITLAQVEQFKIDMERIVEHQKVDFNNFMKSSTLNLQRLRDFQQQLDISKKTIAENASPDYAAAKKEIAEMSAILAPIQSSMKTLFNTLNTLDSKTLANWNTKVAAFKKQITDTPEVALSFNTPLASIEANIAQIQTYLAESKTRLEEVLPLLKTCSEQSENFQQYLSGAQATTHAVEKTDKTLDAFLKSLIELNKISPEQFQHATPEVQSKALQFSSKLEQAKLPKWTNPKEGIKGGNYVTSTNG